MIYIKNGRKSFKDLVIFDDLNLKINEPGLYFIQGSSGSGKSTLLNLLAGYDSFDSGTIDIDDNIATIFQNYELIQEMNIEENIFLQVNPDVSTAQLLLDELGVSHLLKNYPSELSGGQKQRVGIARALLLNPNIILCDEPTESLDIENKNIVMKLLKDLSKDKIVLIASHDSKIIDTYADQVFYLENKQLIIKKEYSSNDQLRVEKKKTFDKKQVYKYVRKIIKKRNLLLSLCFVLLTCLLQSLYLYENKLFHIPTTTQVLNSDMVYIEAIGSNEKFIEEGYTSILKFKHISYKDKEIEMNVYPYVENDKSLYVEGELPSKYGVLVNQNVLEKLNIKDWKNTEIEGIYLFGATQKTMSFKIVGVIHEQDSALMNIYYNLNDILEEFDQEEHSYGLTNKGYLLRDGMNFQVKVGYEGIKSYYKQMLSAGNVFVKAPLYEERLDMQSGIQVYKFMYLVIEIVLFVITLLFIFVSINVDVKSFLKSCIILCSQGIEVTVLKKCFVLEKLKYVFPMLLIESGMVVFIGYKFLGPILNSTDYILLILISVILLIIYCICITIEIRKIRYEEISKLLKNDN